MSEVAVVDATAGPELDIVEGGGRAYAVIWPGMGAQLRSMHRISLEAGASTKQLRHESESVYYVISGSGRVSEEAGADGDRIVEGSMVHVEPGTPYVLTAGDERMELVGGPSPADTRLYPGEG